MPMGDDPAYPGTMPGRNLANAPQMNIPGYEGCNFMKGSKSRDLLLWWW